MLNLWQGSLYVSIVTGSLVFSIIVFHGTFELTVKLTLCCSLSRHKFAELCQTFVAWFKTKICDIDLEFRPYSLLDSSDKFSTYFRNILHSVPWIADQDFQNIRFCSDVSSAAAPPCTPPPNNRDQTRPHPRIKRPHHPPRGSRFHPQALSRSVQVLGSGVVASIQHACTLLLHSGSRLRRA